MTTTQTISREQLQEFIRSIESDYLLSGSRAFELKIAKYALAAMDAKSRKLFTCSGCGAEGLDEPLESKCHCNEDGAHWVESVLFTAPPAPVAVPDKWPEKITWSHHDDMTQAEVLAWNNAIDACRAAMQAEPVTAANTLPPHVFRELVNQLRDTAVKYQGSQQLRAAICKTLCTVITPAAPEQQNRQQNIPENILASLIDAVNRLLDNDGCRGRFSAIECHEAHEEIERLLAAAPAAPEQEV